MSATGVSLLLLAGAALALAPAAAEPNAQDLQWLAPRMAGLPQPPAVPAGGPAAPPPDEKAKSNALLRAVLAGDVKTVGRLLAQGADPNARAFNGEIALTRAAVLAKNSESITELLLSNGAQAGARDGKGDTALILACGKNRLKVAEHLLKSDGSIVDLRGHGEETALTSALAWPATPKDRIKEDELLPLIKLLLEHRADVNLPADWKETPLLRASALGYPEIVELLLKAGAAIDAGDYMGKTALIAAAMEGRLDVAQILIEAGAGVNARSSGREGRTALLAAVVNRNLKMARLLLDRRADWTLANKLGQNALHLAAIEGQPEMIALLDERGADATTLDAEGNTPLLLAARAGRARTRQIETLRALLGMNRGPADAAAYVNRRNAKGYTALWYAVILDRVELVEALLDLGAEKDMTWDEGPPTWQDGPYVIKNYTALMLAALKGHGESAKALLARKADYEFQDKYTGRTALALARRSPQPRYARIAEMLLNAGAWR